MDELEFDRTNPHDSDILGGDSGYQQLDSQVNTETDNDLDAFEAAVELDENLLNFPATGVDGLVMS